MPIFPDGQGTAWQVLNATGLRQNNFNAVRLPDVGDDHRFGWEVGSRWYFDGVEYVCKSNIENTAKWEPASDASAAALAQQAVNNVIAIAPNVRKLNTEATRAPLPSDDASQGYGVGSRWLWQGQEWAAVDVTPGAARWALMSRITPQMFGAVGNGVADDSPAFQAMFNFMVTQDVCGIWIPAGKYRLASKVSVSRGTAANYSILGTSQSSVIIGDNTDGGIQITTTWRHVYITIDGLTFSPARAGAGTGFEYTTTAGGVSRHNVLRMSNCIFKSHDGGDLTSTWDEPIKVTGVNRPSFNNVVAWRVATAVKPYAILNLDGCYKPIITDCYFNGPAQYGITNDRGTDENEGFFLGTTTINGADIGVRIEQDGRHPEIWIVDCHINTYVKGVYIRNCKYIWLCRNLMYTYAGAGQTFYDYDLPECDSVVISENIYRGVGSGVPNRRHVYLTVGTRFVQIDDHGLNAATAVSPYFVAGGCIDVSIALPSRVQNYDYANYPTELVECLSESNVIVTTPTSVTNFNSSAAQSPTFTLVKESSSPANDDNLGALVYLGRNTAGEMLDYATVQGRSLVADDGNERGQLRIFTRYAGVPQREGEFSDGLTLGTLSARGLGTVTLQGASNKLMVGLGTSAGIYSGAGSPEGAVAATVGSIYTRTDGGAGSSLYVKESGTGNTGWAAK